MRFPRSAREGRCSSAPLTLPFACCDMRCACVSIVRSQLPVAATAPVLPQVATRTRAAHAHQVREQDTAHAFMSRRRKELCELTCPAFMGCVMAAALPLPPPTAHAAEQERRQRRSTRGKAHRCISLSCSSCPLCALPAV